MKKLIFFIFILGLSFQLYSTEPLELKTFFQNDDIKKIDNREIITRMYVRYNAKNENSCEKITIPRTKYNDEDFSNYEIITDEKGFIPYKLTDQSKLEFYNIISSFSKLNGMVYYSRRAGKVKELIKKCYRVESLSGNKYDDIKYDETKPKITNMFLQKDNKFGTLIYRSELFNEGNNFVLINTCLEPITKLIFTINEQEEYKIITFFIYDIDKKGYYFYSFQAMRVRVDFILKSGMIGPTSFSNRLRASTVHLAKLLSLDWNDKLNPWKGKYDTY
ncbi:MAG: hypothetical protein KAT05_00780 [Spirochaetes bacterium]|nr:hypothetical protein [Spirochaetota bacterium]